jgi:prepilin-type N-terminal cleavage/methylation domain-containing protein
MVQRIRKVQNDRQGGFTLIELLIVIVVLGILAGIVVLGLGSFRQDATTAACKADA